MNQQWIMILVFIFTINQKYKSFKLGSYVLYTNIRLSWKTDPKLPDRDYKINERQPKLVYSVCVSAQEKKEGRRRER